MEQMTWCPSCLTHMGIGGTYPVCRCVLLGTSQPEPPTHWHRENPELPIVRRYWPGATAALAKHIIAAVGPSWKTHERLAQLLCRLRAQQMIQLKFAGLTRSNLARLLERVGQATNEATLQAAVTGLSLEQSADDEDED